MKIRPDFFCFLVAVNQPSLLFVHHIWGKQYYEAMFFLSHTPQTEYIFSRF